VKLANFQEAYRDAAATTIKQIKSTNPLDADDEAVEKLDKVLEDMRALIGIANSVRAALDDAILPEALKRGRESEESPEPEEEEEAPVEAPVEAPDEDLSEVFASA
jgi:hypothetical protein